MLQDGRKQRKVASVSLSPNAQSTQPTILYKSATFPRQSGVYSVAHYQPGQGVVLNYSPQYQYQYQLSGQN